MLKNKLKKIKMKGMLISSFGMVVGNIPFIIISNHLVKWYYLLGLTTSVLNHGSNNAVLFRYIDRGVMAAGAVLDIYYIKFNYEYLLWFLAIKCYFISKYTGKRYYHIGAHFFVTLLHNSILIN